MALPELTQKLVETKLGAYCTNKIPAHARAQLRLSFSLHGNTVTLFEERVVYDQPDKWTKMPVAQFRLNVIDHLWHLYCANLRRQDGWLLYPNAPPTKDIDALLMALDQDTTGVFWG